MSEREEYSGTLPCTDDQGGGWIVLEKKRFKTETELDGKTKEIQLLSEWFIKYDGRFFRVNVSTDDSGGRVFYCPLLDVTVKPV